MERRPASAQRASDWAGGKGESSRLHDPQDILRGEVARAFGKCVTVIPVLLEGAPIPEPGEIPDELEGFSELHALSLPEARFDNDLSPGAVGAEFRDLPK